MTKAAWGKAFVEAMVASKVAGIQRFRRTHAKKPRYALKFLFRGSGAVKPTLPPG
jgi:hypothetical protein